MRIDFGRQFELISRCFADQEALVNVERKRRFGFRELHLLTNRIANAMRDRLGLGRDDTYLTILDNDNLSLLHLWTALKALPRGAWTNYRDSLDEHLSQVERARPKVVFLEHALLDRYHDPLRARGCTLVCLDTPPRGDGVLDFWELVDEASEAETRVEREAAEEIVLLRFTGGTTGRGKCAQYTLDNWLGARDAFYALPEPLFRTGMRLLHFAPISHGSGLLMLPTLFRGGCTLTQNVPDLVAWCRSVEAERVTATMMVPTLLYRLLELPEARECDLSSLETLFYGAAPMSPDKLAALQERFGNVFVQLYAATESAAIAACLGKADHARPGEAGRRILTSAGRVVPGSEVRIVDEAGNDLPAGELGEIWLRSRGTISGYFENPEGTMAEFQDGYWKSGDVGTLDAEGFVSIVDRKKDMIITGGFNVYATEVEAALASHPAVLMCAVVGIPHEEWGEAVHAEVVLQAGARATPEELIAHAKGRLGRFKVPKSIVLVDQLPTSVVGKVLRRQVREKYWKGRERRVS